MKKRLIALALCLVMLATCLGAGVDVLSGDLVPDEVPTVTEVPDAEPVPTDAVAEPEPTDTVAEPDSTLYDKLMACETSDEFEAIAEAAGDEQISALTETELAALEAHYAQIQADAEVTKEEYPIPAVNYTNVAPFLPPVSGEVRMLRAARAAANYAANDTATDNGMKISKTATANADGSYTITLEAYATGEKVTTVVTEDIPTDIILVLDQSGSMEDDIYSEAYPGSNHNGTYYVQSNGSYVKVTWCSDCDAWTDGCSDFLFWHSEGEQYSPKASAEDNETGHVQFYSPVTRLDALKTAVTNFTNAVAEKAAGEDGDIATTEDNINHRIAMVGFADCGTNMSYENTEIFIGSDAYGYGNAAQAIYGTAFQDMSTNAGKNNVLASVNMLDANGSTYVDCGLDLANGIFGANPVPKEEKRNRVVIVFTDGAPGYNGEYNNKDYGSSGDAAAAANQALTKVSTTKNMCGATVYTVGIFSGADATSAGDNTGNATQRANWFMQKLSSNNGTPQTPSYYLSAADADSLNSIFQQISNQIESGGSSSTLTAESVVKDIISPQFTLPAGATADSITLETYKYKGTSFDAANAWEKNPNAMGATASIGSTDNQVSVTGFNFSENWCGSETNADGSTTYHGNKLVISFKVQPKAGFLGGNDVTTNASAGIYENSSAQTPVRTFDQPEVNVPIKDVTVTANDKNVYLMGEVTADQLKAGAEVKVGNVKLDLSKENYGLESWQTEYVNITVKVKDKDGNVISDKLADLTEDTTYTVEVTVAPKTQGTSTPEKGDAATAKTGKNDPAAVYVFIPEVTFKDSAINLGDTPDYADNLESVVWKHNGDVADSAMGRPPELTYTYEYDPDAAFRADTTVEVTEVLLNSVDVLKYADFKFGVCDYNNCDSHGDWKFVVHIKTFDLTIIKYITNYESKLYGSQDFVFNVKCEDKNIDIDVVVNVPDEETQGSVTIKGLPVGTYTITENTGWSWRYELQGVVKADGATGTLDYEIGSSSATYTPSGTNHQIIFTNNWVQAKWLSFTDSVKNIFGKPNT